MASSYGGTKQKCTACAKTVYWVEELTADNRVYHKSCFRCHHCKGTLKLSNYSSYDGVLYCKPHFDQLFKMTGRLDKSFEGPNQQQILEFLRWNSREVPFLQKNCVSDRKGGSSGKSYHRACFRCARGGCMITPLNYVTHESRLYCKHHHSQLFKEKGNFSKLDSHEQFTKHNNSEQTPKLDNHEQSPELGHNEQPVKPENHEQEVAEEVTVAIMENVNGTA